MFCMLLRKHLSGGRLIEVTQPEMERCANFVFSCTDEMGDTVEKRLVVELMGRTCNVYLLSPDGRIIDCLRRVGLDEGKRPALPGMYYQDPEPVSKMNPKCMDLECYVNLFGYNPKFGIDGKAIGSVTYKPQPYNSTKALYL